MDGDRIWKNLRRFSGWMCAGCVSGLISFAVVMRGSTVFQEVRDTGVTRRQFYQLSASNFRILSLYDFFYPAHLLCVIYALNMMLRRVSDHASHPNYNAARDFVDRRSTVKRFDFRDCVGQYTLYYWARSVNVIAVVLCVLNVLTRMVAGGVSVWRAGRFDEAASETDPAGGDTERSISIYERRDGESLSATAIAVSQVFEAAVLAFMAVAFMMFFPASIVMFRRVEQRLDTLLQEMSLRTDVGNAFLPFEFSPCAADGSEMQTEMPIVDARRYLQDIKASAATQRWRFSLCLVSVSTALVALALHAGFIAYVGIGREKFCDDCGKGCSQRSLMQVWYLNTPEFTPLVSSLSSTLPLFISLWMMTTPEDRELLMHPHRFRTDAIAMQPVENDREARLLAERIRLGINLQ